MNEFLKMDIFFVVATISVVVLTLFVAYVLWRVSRVLAYLEHIAEQASLESEHIREDLAELRADLKEGGSRLGSALSFFTRVGARRKKNR